MGITERRGRQRAEREHRIVEAARAIAGREGWHAVTIRRLAEEIEYSQPVIYSHFESKEAIVAAVAVQGFVELTSRLEEAAARRSIARDPLVAVAAAYLDFALANAALYEAMFTLPIGLRFAEADTRPELRAAFRAITAVVRPFHIDVESVGEMFWASLHGLAELERSRRIRHAARMDRVTLLVQGITGG